MSKLDPQLEFLADDGMAQLDAIATSFEYARYGVYPRKAKRGSAAPPPADVDILVQFDGDPAALEAVGMTVRAVAGDVISGSISLDRLPALAEIAEVERVESSRALYAELDLATADTHVDNVQTGPPGFRGAGVIVGIVDSGIDFTHDSFRRGNGQTRILRIWDQGLTATAGETPPAGFNYGVEYTDGQINAALGAADPFQTVRHRDQDSVRHGTHVSGIAAGDGSAPGQGQPAGTFAGVATEADIIVVGNVGSDAEGLGNSARALEAVTYIFQQAAALGRPCAINMSLGDNLGPHDGTALLERGIDNLLGGQGRVLVKSAGNAAADRIHAQGNVTTGATVDVRFNQPANDNSTNQMDVWYEGADRFTVTVVDPAGNTAGPVAVGATTQVTLTGGNVVRISHRDNDASNGDKRIFLTFAPGAAGTMRAGDWTLRLTSVTSPSGGRFDAWIQRGQVIPQFLAPHESPERTISTPGTAREVITAASHVTRGAGVGSRSTFSSRGPTRDGRLAPTISAPGEWIISARGHATAGQDPYVQLAGTSMAAPHVTGAAALLLQKTPTLSAAQVAQILSDNARTDAFTGATPNTAWGAGKLDLLGAFPQRIIPLKTVVEPSCRVTLVPSVIQATCRSVATPCIPASTLCQSVAIPCHSVPLCIDPGHFRSVVNCGPVLPTTVIDPTTVVVNPTFVNPTFVVNPALNLAVNRVINPGIGGVRVGGVGPEATPEAPRRGVSRSIPVTDCAPTVPGYDCPYTVPGYDCPQTIPGYDCPQPEPQTVPGVDCPQPMPQTIPGYDCPQPGTIPTMDCPTVASVPGYDCPIWTIPQVDCPPFYSPFRAVPARSAGAQGAGAVGADVGARLGGPGSGLPACGFGVSSPRDCTWWSVPGVNCGTVQPPSFALDCPSVMPSDCLSRLIRICPPPPSVPVANCQTVPIQNCWAPTTAPGCDNPVSVLRCPSRVCTTVINPTIVNTTVVGTNPIRDANAGFPPYGAASRGGLTEDQGDARPPADKGYYDYDESWWE